MNAITESEGRGPQGPGGDPRGGHPPGGQARQRRLLVGVALMFFAPLGFSFLLYYGHGWHPDGHVNKGELVQPVRTLPMAALPLMGGGVTDAQVLRRKWTMLYVQRGLCGDDCMRHLYDTRQVRTALDREMNRVQRMFIASENCCDLQKLRGLHPDLIVVREGQPVEPLLALLPAPNSDRIYLVDPLGNLMMFYAPDSKPKGLLEDMKRLLQLSQIG
jgi:hypothetical protein